MLVVPRGWRNVEKRPTLTIFFSWIWLTPHLPNIVSFPSSNVFFECFFVIWFKFSWFVYQSLPSTREPAYKIQIMLETVLCMNLWSEEHTWEITESGEFCELKHYLQYHSRDRCVYGLATCSKNILVHLFAPQFSRRWRRVLHSHRNIKMYPPSTRSLTHPTAFGARLLDSGNESPCKSDLLFFNYIPPPPCWVVLPYHRSFCCSTFRVEPQAVLVFIFYFHRCL